MSDDLFTRESDPSAVLAASKGKQGFTATREKFAKVAIGMNAKDVFVLLGSPSMSTSSEWTYEGIGWLEFSATDRVTRIRATTQPPILAESRTSAIAAVSDSSILSICTFNIQFLGASAKRDNAALAELLKDYDIVVVQELTAAPATTPAQGPDSRQKSAKFFKEMADRGFDNVLSESDTGVRGPLPNYGTATEWFVTFFKPSRVHPVTDIPHGFISQPLAANPKHDRVPYAFAFRSANSHVDFVLISVHLNPDQAPRRKVELAAIGDWIEQEERQSSERDYIVLGDTNLQNAAELHADSPANFISLNDACVATNTNVNGPKPYDHVLFDPENSTEIDRTYGFKVVSLVEAMRLKWRGPGGYPGGPPYDHNRFRAYYSDHNPVAFRIRIPAQDDD